MHRFARHFLNSILFAIFLPLLSCTEKSPQQPEKEKPGPGSSPAQDWDFVLGETSVVRNSVKVPIYPWFPDGHITVLPNGAEQYIMFWAEFHNFRSIGSTQYPEDHSRLSPEEPVFGARGNWDSYDNGGSWLMSVFRQTGSQLIGFYHAEDHWYPHTDNNIAWKSIGVAYSADNGNSWTDGGQIITSSRNKPESPAWGGTGDHCVIWDETTARWICYYQEHYVHMAASSDPDGKPGTWFKYRNGHFDQPGLAGDQTPVPGIKSVPGGNPSVHFNTYLQLWIMVWHGWDPAVLYISSSEDGVEWAAPRNLADSTTGGRAWYATIIGETDILAGRNARLYYAQFSADGSSRQFISRPITFKRND